MVDGVLDEDRPKKARAGLTVAIPVTGNQSTKLAWSRGASKSIGSDFTISSVGYQFFRFDRP
jgi:hypothetical protein